MCRTPLSRAACVAAILAAPLYSRSAAAEEVTAHACIAAHGEGQELRSQGTLLAARARFTTCMNPACPDVVRADCAAFIHEVEAALPSVLLAATFERSDAPQGVTAYLDQNPTPLRVDRTPIQLDPGAHRVTFRLPDGRSETRSFVLRAGEKLRLIEVQFAPREEPFRVPTLSYVLGGAGVLASASFAYFGLDGRAKENDLQRCAPRCDEQRWRGKADAMRASYLAADISLLLAVASFGAGTFLLVDAMSDDAPATDRSAGAVDLQLGGAVTSSGVALGATGTF